MAENPKRLTLSNGLKVLLVKDLSLPYVEYQLLVPMGSSKDPTALEGLSYFTAQAMERGTTSKTASQIVSEIENLGSSFQASTTRDYSFFSVDSLSWNSEPLLEIFSDIITRPSFLEKEIAWVKNQTLSQIKKLPEQASAFADRILLSKSNLFQHKNYNHSTIGSLKSVKTFSPKILMEHYQNHFTPEGAVLGVVGQYPSDIKSKLEKAFSSWKRAETTDSKLNNNFLSLFSNFLKKNKHTDKEPPQPLNTPPSAVKAPVYLIINNNGQVQSEIRMGKNIRLPRSSPDYLGVKIVNIILGGGGLDSRLFEEIRSKHGLTYSIRSRVHPLRRDGIFAVSTPTRLDATRHAADLIMDVMEDFHKKGVLETELNRAKKNYKIQLLSSLETAESRLSRRIFLNFHNLPFDLDSLNSSLNRLNLKSVNQIIKKYFQPESLKFIIFTDYQKVKNQFKDISSLEVKEAVTFL